MISTKAQIVDFKRFSTVGSCHVATLAIFATDDSIYVLGKFQDNLPLSDTLVLRSSGTSIFLAKYEAGQFIWAKKLTESSKGESMDSSGTIHVTNNEIYIGFEMLTPTKLFNSLNYAPGYLVLALDKIFVRGIYSLYLTKITDIILAAKEVKSGNCNMCFSSLCSCSNKTKTSSELYLSGNTNNRDATIDKIKIRTDKDHDFIIARINTMGVVIGLKQLDFGSANIFGMKIHRNQLELGGNFYHRMGVDGVVLESEDPFVNLWWGRANLDLKFTSLNCFIGNNDNFTATKKWDENGYHMLMTDFGVDYRGNRYFTGRINGEYYFGCNKEVNTMVRTTGDTIFIVKVDRFDVFERIILIDYDCKLSMKVSPCLSISNDGGVHLSSSFHFSVRFDSKNMIEADGSIPVFVAKYDSEGNLIWVNTFATTETYHRKHISCGSVNGVHTFGNLNLAESKMTSFLSQLN